MAHNKNCIGYVCTCIDENMFKPMNRLRNKYCLDLDIIVVKVIGKTEAHVNLDVWYYNRNYDTIIDYKPDPVNIKREDFHNWTVVRSKYE